MLEDVRPPRWLTAVGAAQCALAALLLPVVLLADLPTAARTGACASALALAVVGTTVCALRLRVDLTATGLTVRLRPFRGRAIARDDVVRAEPVTLRPSSTGGLGWRATGPRSRAVLLSYGSGVRLDLADGSTLRLRTDRPHDLLAHLGA